MGNEILVNLRVNAKWKYILDVMARVNGTTKTNIIKGAILKAFEADEVATEAFNASWDMNKEARIKKLGKFDRSLLKQKEEEIFNK